MGNLCTRSYRRTPMRAWGRIFSALKLIKNKKGRHLQFFLLLCNCCKKIIWDHFMDRLNWFFEWSDRTNQDEKLTLRVVSSNLVQVQIYDQRPICDSGPDGRIVIFLKGQTRPIRMKKSPSGSNLVQVQNWFLTRGQFEILGLKAKYDFSKGQTGPIKR